MAVLANNCSEEDLEERRNGLAPGLRSFQSFLVAGAVIAFVLNWGWEMAQGGAYVELAALPWDQRLVRCTIASLGDVALTLGVYGIGSLAARRLRWGWSGDWNVYATGALLGCASALAIEWRALAFDVWSYNEKMPIVPLAEVGLWAVPAAYIACARVILDRLLVEPADELRGVKQTPSPLIGPMIGHIAFEWRLRRSAFCVCVARTARASRRVHDGRE